MNLRIVTQAEVDALQKRCQRGTTSHDAANSLHADCYGTLGALMAMVDEADRRAGAAERELEHVKETCELRSRWLSNAKREAGYPDNISFDVVWADALRALKASKS